MVGHIWNPSTREAKAGKRERKRSWQEERERKGLFVNAQFVLLEVGS